jgi:hypothetical protein
MKTCSTCKRELPYSEFTKCPRYADGYVGQCKKCRYAKQQEWRKNNPERRNARARAQYANNRDKMLESSRKWKEKIVKNIKRWKWKILKINIKVYNWSSTLNKYYSINKKGEIKCIK